MRVCVCVCITDSVFISINLLVNVNIFPIYSYVSNVLKIHKTRII